MSNSNPAEKSAKKLKQACLPFKLINSPGDEVSSKCRKRKLSGTENDDTRVENPKVELLNGGTKCFIKSDDEMNDEDIDMQQNDVIEPDNSIVSMKNNDKILTDEETSKVDEKVVDDSISVSSDSDNIQNDTSVNSTSDNEKHTTPTSKNTPKYILKKLESAKKQKERQRLKLEKEKAREEKLKEQAEKLLLKEQKRNAEIEAKRLRDLEKEKERKLKEEEKKAKELEKEKERKLKEEEKKAKELEKEKQKEEKLLREEMEKKKKEKVKAAFVGFFKAKRFNLDTSKKDVEIIDQEQETYFMPFQTKQDMKIAPLFRAYLNRDRKKEMDKCICLYEQNKDLLYVNLLKTGKHIPSKSDRTWPSHVEDDADIIVIDSTNVEGDGNTINTSLKSNSQKNRWKLLQFNENKRPPYWGTWRKKSVFVKPRRPFAYDKLIFDYEIDSDDEWEEEDPGESIHGTDNEEEPDDDYEVDNDVFVPHGYLSDEEGQDNDTDDSEEAQKEKLKLLGEEFEAEIKKKTERIKPRLVGCVWIPNNVTNPENVSKSVADTLLKYRCIWDDEEPIITEAPIIVDTLKDLSSSENKKSVLLPDSIIPDLIKFIHGNSSGIKIAARNFTDEIVKNSLNIDDNNLISVSSVKRTIKAIATKATHISPWCVNKDKFDEYGVQYPISVEIELPKPIKSPSVKKITSFMTLPCPKADSTLMNKSCTEIDESVPESTQVNFIPKNLFNHEKFPNQPTKDVVKEEQKIIIVGGKKRITPILLSPKKNFKSTTDRKPKEKSLSPENEIVCEDTSKSIVRTV